MKIPEALQHLKPADRRDILELQSRIEGFRAGQEDEERFKLYRLTRGVYGQRQLGVQMFRTKIPYGRITPRQLIRLADISERYTNGNLHLTTRQNIQLHYIRLEDSPQVWVELADAGLTAREACGNTVRNITASPTAGIDPEEPFDVSPYVQASFEYFLRNPICQEMGRKIKPAFSSSERDSAFTYFHDFGFIPRIKDGKRGFKVVIGGGLGAVGFIAQPVYEFLEEERIIPFMEACIRVFDRYGEREKRMKARMKCLVKELGLEAFLKLVKEEWPALKNKTFAIDTGLSEAPSLHQPPAQPAEPADEARYQLWKSTNTFEQKQPGYFAVNIKLPLGNIHAREARELARIIEQYAADDIRLTVQQGMLLRFVRPQALPALFNELDRLGLAQIGANTIADVTACPGTDTCALGVTNSTGLAQQLEELILNEFEHLVEASDIRIKISGCMNSCGQHMAAQIGFHGSSLRLPPRIVPAMQVVLGGGVSPNGEGFIAEKVIKLPTKRIPSAVRLLLLDFEQLSTPGQLFNEYFQSQGKRYFYSLLKPLASLDDIQDDDFFDWGQDDDYRQSIGVGECAGVSLDVVGTIIEETRQKVALAEEALQEQAFADGIYHAYTAFVIGAKALLLAIDIKCNTQKGILEDFQEHYIKTKAIELPTDDFEAYVLEMKTEAPGAEFAARYLAQARQFFQAALATRSRQLQASNGKEKVVIENYYKA
ncbi:MAG: nitrite/sulfite reductase [Lewinellaceae bacterium]|nr:nitrite/sulfite reductase [Phaeodactylibacter sp.]MCB9035835.1 nitrite/sulfite reductase [Lewinellaceae bacterium]